MTESTGIRQLTSRAFIITLLASLLLLSGCEYSYTGAGFDIVEETPGEAPWFNVYRPADMTQAIADSGHLLPVIVWANGGCFRADFPWQPLFKRWAAEGYVVIAFSEAPAAEGGALGMTSVADHGALIDWATSQASYSDMLDANRIVAAGNSCGGVTAMGLAAEDPRVSMVFVLSGSSAVGSISKRVLDGITVPVGFVVGGDTDIAGANAKKDFAAMDQTIPAMLVSRREGGHMTVSTTVSILEQAADISFHWMDLVLYGNQASYDELNSEDVCSDCVPGDWSMASRNLETLIP